MKNCNGSIKNEEGFVIVFVLMILVVVSIIGISSSNTSLTEQKIARNEMIYKETFYRADSGPYTVAKLVSRIIDEKNEQVEKDFNFSFLSNGIDSNADPQNIIFRQIMGFDKYDGGDKDVSFGNTQVDIKRNRTVSAPGAAVEFSSGMEGVGTGSKGGVHIYFSLDSKGLNESSQQTNVVGEYRKVPDIMGGL